MQENVMHIALDVDDKHFTGHGICLQTGELIAFKCRPVLDLLLSQIKKYVPKGYRVKLCYETTYLGFSLARELIAQGYHCDVIAASLIPTLSSDRVKTDRLDAEKMALYYANEMLVSVNIPQKEDEVLRQLIRFRKAILGQIKEMKNRFRSQGKIFGIEIPKTDKWTKDYGEKLYTQLNAIVDVNLRDLLMYYKDLIESHYVHLSRVENRIEEYSKEDKYKKTHDALICLRGIKSLTAMTLIAEIGDIKRFSHPKKLAAYVGLDIAEYSSGGKEKKMGITKMGNSHIRGALIESQQIIAKRPSVSRRVKSRREGAPPEILNIATRCDERLYKKSRQMMLKGKHSNKIKVACAREFTGFIWEMMRKSRENQNLSVDGVTV